MHVFHGVVIGPRRAVEGEDDEAPGVEGGEEGGQRAADEGIDAH